MRHSLTPLIVLLAGLVVGRLHAEDTNAADLTAIAGQWQLMSIEFAGELRDVPGGDEAVVVFKDDKAFVKEVEQFSFKLDSTTDPKIIDFTRTADPDKGQILEGIYKLDGDTLTVCLWSGMGTKSRPSEFATKPGTVHVLVVMKRK